MISEERVEFVASGTAEIASIIPKHREGEVLIFHGKPARMNEIVA